MPTHALPEPASQRVSILKQLSRGSVRPGDEPLPELNDPSEAPAGAGAVPSEKRGVSKWAKTLYGAGLTADVGSTAKLLMHGGHEANPLINFAGDKAAIPIGLAESIGTYILAKKLLGDKHPKIMNALVGGAGIMHGAAAAHNLMLPKPGQPAEPESHETIVYDTGNGGFVPPK